ncbi:hypothetical protein JCM8208_002117 [Rhodotorula glutinis]
MRTFRPDESRYFSTSAPPTLACLNQADTEAYLERIGLASGSSAGSSSPDLASEPPSLALLAKILMAHHLSVPYDSSAIHVGSEAWARGKAGQREAIQWRAGPGQELGEGNFRRIVLKRQGGYCFSTNCLAAALLRGFGFRVSEVGARVYLQRGKDPAEVGWGWWSQTTHVCLLVDWEGSGGRWFCDFGFGGGGSPIPIPLRHGATSPSLSRSESFLLCEEAMPLGDDTSFLHDPPAGFTLYRRVVPAGFIIPSHADTKLEPGHFFTPCIHFSLSTLAPLDIVANDFYNSQHPSAPWASIFLTSRLLPNGARRSLCHGIPALEAGAPQDGRKYAKLYSKEGIKGEEYDVEWVPFDTQSIGAVLERDFGFLL